MANTDTQLMPPDQIVGYARRYKEELASGKALAHKSMIDGVYPLLESLAQHVDALWDAAEGGPPWIDAETGKTIISMINKLFELVPEAARTPALKDEVAGVVAAIVELIEEETPGE